ncbi:citrate lyase beta subunit [Streptomyces sp. MJP52]|nr:citrate lyase beta subunit [Streptomyces sp. MJP52]
MTAPQPSVNRLRPRRSCLAVPGSNPRFLEKAQGLPADQVFLDLEDACAPLAKPEARHTIVKFLNEGDWTGKTRVVRVNDWTTEWTYRDVVTVVEGAGPNLDCIMLPKVQNAEQVVALDLLLTQIEKTMGFEVGRIGIEAQIENAQGLNNVNAIAEASPRLETIIFGPADFMASINMKSLVVGEQPPGYGADAYHYILMKILMAARANDLQAIDGPYLQIRNVDGFREVAGARRGPGLRRQVGAAPGPGGRRQRGVLALAGGLRPRRADPGRVRVLHLGGGRQEGLGDARRRDDRRGQPEDGAGHRGQGPRGRHEAHQQVRDPGGLSRCSSGAPTRSSRSGRRTSTGRARRSPSTTTTSSASSP